MCKRIELLALWFNNYKCFDTKSGTTINFNSKYKSVFNLQDDKFLHIEVEENNKYNIFPDNLNIITIVGVNGSGKTTILNMIKSILANNKKDLPSKYCLLLYDGQDYIYIKSPNIDISQQNFRECKTWYKNGKRVGDIFDTLMFKPFMENDFNSAHSKYYNSYDNELKIQDQINNYFVYDRLDENVVAFSMGRTINNLKSIKIFTEYNNITFNEFGWEFNVKDCYKHIVNRLRKKLKNNTDNDFPMTYGVVLHNSKYLPEFYELVNKIVYFKDEIYRWHSSRLKLENVFKDILFFSAIFEFDFFLSHIEETLKEHYQNDIYLNIKNNKKLGEIEQQKTDIIDEILKNIIDTATEKMSPAEFLKLLVNVFDNKLLKYNNYPIQSSYIDYWRKNIEKVQAKMEITNLYDIFASLFNNENLTFKLKKTYRLNLDKFLNQSNYDENTDDFSAIYMYKYLYSCPNDAIKTICNIFPNDFIGKYFNINLYKSLNDKDITFKDLSTGEQRILKFFADILYCNPRELYLFDEMDQSWHPEWQRYMISLLVELFQLQKYRNKKINIIITTHSPIILSDIPNSNIVLLDSDKNRNRTIVKESETKTFAANIYTLFRHPFFLQSSIGDYAEYKLRSVIKKLSSQEEIKTDCIGEDIIQKRYRTENLEPTECQDIINVIGEDLTKKILLNQLRIYNEKNNEL